MKFNIRITESQKEIIQHALKQVIDNFDHTTSEIDLTELELLESMFESAEPDHDFVNDFTC